MVSGLTTPVAFIIFNRREAAARVFAAIRAARPAKVFVIADGPRPGVASDAENCRATRAILDKVDWPCQVCRLFAQTNLGLRRNVSEGLDWLFQQTERAIVLEDDCLPDPSFFPFCEELLERYAEDPGVGMIGGTNFDPAATAPANGDSYYFSQLPQIWGWASWRRAWQLCDHEMRAWPSLRQSGWLDQACSSRSARNFWRRHFDDGFERHPDGLNTWDIPWFFACWYHKLMTIIPRTNLIANIGFGADAAHTKLRTRTSQLPTQPIGFPLQHPAMKAIDRSADAYVQTNFCEGITPAQRLYWKLRLPLPIWAVRRTLRWLGQ